jgi:hypothetical protein
MFPNAKISERMALLATLEPVSQAAATVVTTYVPASNFATLMAVLQTGVLGTAATVDAKLRQAVDSSGTSVKDITGKAVTQIVKATGDAKQVIINLKTADLDVEGGFAYVCLSVTVGTAASLISAQLWGCDARFDPASAFNQAGVAQVV